MTNRMIGWGVVCGVGFGLALWIGRSLFVGLFSPDPEVQALVSQVLVVVALVTPIAGIVYVLDGVLIGAGDSRYLALAGVIALIAYAPLALIVAAQHGGLVWLWIAYGGYVTARLITLVLAGTRHRVAEGGGHGLTDRAQGWRSSGRSRNQVLESRPRATRAPMIMVSPASSVGSQARPRTVGTPATPSC